MAFQDDFSSTPFHGSDDPWGSSTVVQPPKFVLLVSIISIGIGLSISIFGKFQSSTNSQTTLFGVIGYVLCIVVPIGLLQFSVNDHSKKLREIPEDYASYDGLEVQSKMRKIVLLGLLAAAGPIYLLTSQWAEM